MKISIPILREKDNIFPAEFEEERVNMEEKHDR